ncbi:MAG: 4-hydroxy-tetrahydrodipicolinate synthase [Bdellovibrionales bacterium]
MKNEIGGVITALITPFNTSGKIDFKSLEKLVKFQIDRGVRGFVINGTTGESPTLEKEELKDLWQFVKGIVGPDKFMILGTGSNSTQTTIEKTKMANLWKADAALVVVPYYNKPPQRGLFQHFKKVAEEAEAPILLYNVPGRTACSLSLETTIELSHVPGIVGIKDATGDMTLAAEICKKTRKGFRLLSGDDVTYADYLNRGGHGIISVASHIIPDVFLKITNLVMQNKFDQAKTLIETNKDLIDSLYVEANPIPVKKALQMMGLIESAGMRLPLIEAQKSTEEKLRLEMTKQGLLK